MGRYTIRVNVNRQWREADVSATETLLETLRRQWNAVEVKNGCEQGDCGACTVILNGEAVNACLVLSVQADGKEVTTLKGIGSEAHPHPLQASFVEKGAIQCGYCTPGMVLSAKALLDRDPHPSREAICEAISGNLCRCTGYTKIVEAISSAASTQKRD